MVVIGKYNKHTALRLIRLSIFSSNHRIHVAPYRLYPRLSMLKGVAMINMYSEVSSEMHVDNE